MSGKADHLASFLRDYPHRYPSQHPHGHPLWYVRRVSRKAIMDKLSNKPVRCSNQPGQISWKAVPDFIQKVLTTQGCTLLRHHRERPHLKHIRFQYVPLAYQGELYYLQRWSRDEWGVSPSQIIFPNEGSCPANMLSNGSMLSMLVKNAIATFYGHFPDNSPSHPPSSTRRYRDNETLPLAG